MSSPGFSCRARRIIFNGEDVTNFPAYHRYEAWPAPSNSIFPTMSVIEHILAAQYIHAGVGLFGTILQARKAAWKRHRCTNGMEILSFVDLADRAAMPAVSLPADSGGF